MKKLLLQSVFIIVCILTVTINVSAQGSYNMCVATGTVTDSTGSLYDSGGPAGQYQVDEDCTLLVAPSCATSITLTFLSYATESGFDFIHVYDGTTTNDPELLNISGTTLPGPVTCTSGSMLIVWHSDVSIVDNGFEATWTSVIAASVAPIANFTANTYNPPLNSAVQFTNTSNGASTAWYWQFGDGDTAHRENPTHAYAAPGTYIVTFIPYSCNESDTITDTIVVQAAPQIHVNPLSGFSESVACGDSVTNIMNISNTGGGQLLYSTDGSLVGQIKVLAMTYGTDQFVEFPHTIAAINQYFTNYQLTVTGTTNPGVLSGQLVGQNVLLIPEQENNVSNTVWPNFGPVIQQFLNNGGSVIFLGSASSLSTNMTVTGIFTGTYSTDASSQTVTVIDPNHPITTGLGVNSFTAPSSTFTMDLTNNDIVPLVSFGTDNVVAYRYFGSGKAIFIAFDYFTSNANSARLIANAIQWAGENALPNWIHITPATDTVDASDTIPVSVTFVANSLPAGTYYANISVNSNDPNNPQIAVPCTLTVSGDPIISLSDNCLNYGQVIQHTNVKDTLRITNIGCDTLFINSLTQSLMNSPFSFNPNFSYILPGAYADLVVTYQDNNIGVVNDTIFVNNNDTNMWVCLSANSVPAPVVSPSTNSVVLPVRACGADGVDTLTITNTGVAGAGDLIFTLQALPAWVTASPTSGTIPQGQSLDIILNFNSQTFAGGPVTANLGITSNDPQTPNKIVGITMQVDSNPCLTVSVSSNTCTGFSTFTTTTINTPDTYTWDFGDGGTSNVQNPSHAYPSNGNFTATVIACNSHGCDTVTQNIQAIITGPHATNCYPQTVSYCCGIGVVLFQIYDVGGFKINKISNDAVDGYKDYTCTDTATLLTTVPYNINVQTGQTFSERVRIWLDMNNDTHLDSIAELIYDSTNTRDHGGTFTLPDLPTNVFNQPLRMRVASDYQETNGTGNPTAEPCLDLQFGQVEDYSIFLSPLLSTRTLETETAFAVYPNPFDQTANIDYVLQNASKVSVEIFNVVGEKVGAPVNDEIQSGGRHSYLFSNQPAGIYFVKLTVNGKTATQKIIKM